MKEKILMKKKSQRKFQASTIKFESLQFIESIQIHLGVFFETYSLQKKTLTFDVGGDEHLLSQDSVADLSEDISSPTRLGALSDGLAHLSRVLVLRDVAELSFRLMAERFGGRGVAAQFRCIAADSVTALQKLASSSTFFYSFSPIIG